MSRSSENAAVAPGSRRDIVWASKYEKQSWSHTAVVHTSKKNRKRQFVCLRKVVLSDGAVVWVKGGTQQVDGHWRLLKNHVTRSACNTRARRQLRELVRSHQWRHIHGGVCRFTAMGHLLRSVRQDAVAQQKRETAAFARKQEQRKAAAAARHKRRRVEEKSNAAGKIGRTSARPKPSAFVGVPPPRPAAASDDKARDDAETPDWQRYRNLPFDRRVSVPRPTRCTLRSQFHDEGLELRRLEAEKEGRNPYT
jgi:hypothetical protein